MKGSPIVAITIHCNITAATTLLPVLERLKYLGDVGMTRDIIIDSSINQKNKWYFDGDGPDKIYDIFSTPARLAPESFRRIWRHWRWTFYYWRHPRSQADENESMGQQQSTHS